MTRWHKATAAQKLRCGRCLRTSAAHRTVGAVPLASAAEAPQNHQRGLQRRLPRLLRPAGAGGGLDLALRERARLHVGHVGLVARPLELCAELVDVSAPGTGQIMGVAARL